MPTNQTELLDSYLAIRHRIKNFIALHLLVVDFSSSKRVLSNSMGLERDDFEEVLRDLWIGYFVSLIDNSKGATNAPKVWKSLFPKKAARIRQWERDSQRCLKTLRDYRNIRSFHANESLIRQIATWRQYEAVKADITKLIKTFVDIAILIISEEEKLDGMTARVEAYSKQLNRELPGAPFNPNSLAKYIFGECVLHS